MVKESEDLKAVLFFKEEDMPGQNTEKAEPGSSPVATEGEGESTCPPHHWVIAPSQGPVSLGTCQICQEEREFKNYVESAPWGDTVLRQGGG